MIDQNRSELGVSGKRIISNSLGIREVKEKNITEKITHVKLTI